MPWSAAVRRNAEAPVKAEYFMIGGFLGAGRYFGNLPAVKQNFHLVVIAIVVVSFLPVFFEVLKARRGKSAPSNLSL